MKIVESEDWSAYKSVWNGCMKDYYWHKEIPVFDWHKEEELEDMETDFGESGRVFLEAHQDGEIVGVFGFRYRGKEASMRRWEPTVLQSTSDSEIQDALLKHALDYLSGKGVERTKVIIKHPVENLKVAQHLLDLYENSGFARYQPDGVDLVTRLDDIPSSPSMQENISIDPTQGTIPEKIGEYCVRAYASTSEDLEIHGFDSSVTEYGTAVAVFKSILGGSMGRSPDEFWKVALVDGEPAGFIGGFIPESKIKPVTGILGPFGVFPEHRRLGIGVFLVSELFKSMKSHGCEYAAVGTPSANQNAIRMYEKAGFKMNCHLIHLEKTI